MENVLVPLLFAHITLYLAWKMTAMEEKNSRPDGNRIPVYATGGLGNLVGFSLMTTGVGLVGGVALLDWMLLGLFGVAALVTLGLHYYWKRTARGVTTSLYLPNGNVTLAGGLHLLYVFFITLMVLHFFTTISMADTLSLSLFCFGASLYGLAVVIDKQRGVI